MTEKIPIGNHILPPEGEKNKLQKAVDHLRAKNPDIAQELECLPLDIQQELHDQLDFQGLGVADFRNTEQEEGVIAAIQEFARANNADDKGKAVRKMVSLAE